MVRVRNGCRGRNCRSGHGRTHRSARTKRMFGWPAQRSDTIGLLETWRKGKTARSRTNYAGEAVAAWQYEDVSRFCWYFARGELEGCTVGDSCVTFVNGCGKRGSEGTSLTFREASRQFQASWSLSVLAGEMTVGDRPMLLGWSMASHGAARALPSVNVSRGPEMS
jgi:hypothetical protein